MTATETATHPLPVPPRFGERPVDLAPKIVTTNGNPTQYHTVCILCGWCTPPSTSRTKAIIAGQRHLLSTHKQHLAINGATLELRQAESTLRYRKTAIANLLDQPGPSTPELLDNLDKAIERHNAATLKVQQCYEALAALIAAAKEARP